MDWSDEGIVLAARRHGESGAVATLLTPAHGRYAGLVHGGASRRNRGLLEAGNRVQAVWRARLAEQLGRYALELLESYAAALLEDPLRLAALSAACAVADAALPEREPHPRVYDGLRAFLEALRAGPGGGTPAAITAAAWPSGYVRWELDLLAELGFGLDLSHCAVTGSCEGLAWVSPKTGRAVTAAVGAAYREQLLPLPAFLTAGQEGPAPEIADVLAGLRLTGFFLERHVFSHRRPGGAAAAVGHAPPARERFVDRLRHATAGA